MASDSLRFEFSFIFVIHFPQLNGRNSAIAASMLLQKHSFLSRGVIRFSSSESPGVHPERVTLLVCFRLLEVPALSNPREAPRWSWFMPLLTRWVSSFSVARANCMAGLEFAPFCFRGEWLEMLKNDYFRWNCRRGWVLSYSLRCVLLVFIKFRILLMNFLF